MTTRPIAVLALTWMGCLISSFACLYPLPWICPSPQVAVERAVVLFDVDKNLTTWASLGALDFFFQEQRQDGQTSNQVLIITPTAEWDRDSIWKRENSFRYWNFKWDKMEKFVQKNLSLEASHVMASVIWWFCCCVIRDTSYIQYIVG